MSVPIKVHFLWLIMFSVRELSSDDGHMRWEIKRNKMIFSCRTKDFSKPLRLFDNREKEYARCSFERFGNQSIRCSGRHDSKRVSVDAQKKEVIFTIYKFKSKDIDGTWTCLHGNRKFTSNVSKIKGIVNDTDIYLKAEIYQIDDIKRVSLRCWASRKSRGNNVEFLINNRSEVSITYEPITGKCTDRNGECHPDICSCLPTGKEFNATFPFDSQRNITYSCNMHFKDEETSMIFSKTAYIRFNGNGFEVMRTSSYIIKQPNANNEDTHRDLSSTTRKHDTDLQIEKVTTTSPAVLGDPPNINKGHGTGAMASFAIGSFVVSVLGILVVVFICHQRNQRKETSRTLSGGGETEYLLEDAGCKSEETMTEESYFATGCKSEETMTEESYFATGTVLSTQDASLPENGCKSEETMTEISYFATGCKTEETMTDAFYFATEETNKQMEDMFKSDEAKSCFSIRCTRVLNEKQKFYQMSEQHRSKTSVSIPISPANISLQGEFEINNKHMYVKMAVSKNGFLLVCDSIHRVVLMLVENKLEVSIKLLYTPEDISVIPNIDTAVLTCHTFDLIQFGDLNGRTVIGTKKVDDSATCSVVCTSEYILVGGKMKIMILDHEGTYKRNIEIDCRVRNLSYIDENIYFTEYGSNKVRCIKMNGDDILCHQSQNIAAPINAIPSNKCHIYVLDRGPIKMHKRGPIAIHRLSTSGQTIRLEFKGNVDLQNPLSMCFNNDNTKLYVLNKGGSTICTFTI